MKNSIIIVMILFLLLGCKSVKSTQQIIEKQKDSISYVERVVVDTLRIPGDIISVNVPCDQLTNQSFSKGRAKVKLEPKGNGYTITVSCDSIEKLILSKNIEINRLSKLIKDNTKVIGLSIWQSFWIVIGKLLTAILILILSWKFLL
ncbi:hypothetical protein OIU83_17835 [Flavobacterium sp. LS1R49]|uniref:Uncharacterized protein n=1 Tax=Flavobacterium shii TaxID=2987687 RepID=A0A9X2ZGU6_9FLAO|nr:hypothetical protein [Flavobacterium shii]MCV9929527.1 hypothetical protein [Flavobacterium shii]